MEKYCNKCKCLCHCESNECPNCVNDVCYNCECEEKYEY